jgi:DNA gyrase/topoisomerase IV subunit B
LVDLEERFNMLWARAKPPRRAWIEEHGNEAEADI